MRAIKGCRWDVYPRVARVTKMRVVLSGLLAAAATCFIVFRAGVNNADLLSTSSSWLIRTTFRDTPFGSRIASPPSVKQYPSKELLVCRWASVCEDPYMIHADAVKYHVGQALYFSPTEFPLANLTVHQSDLGEFVDERRQLAATVIRVPSPDPHGLPFDARAVIERYLSVDDVFSREWLYTLFFTPAEESDLSAQLDISPDTLKTLAKDFGTRQVLLHPALRLPLSMRLRSPVLSVVPLSMGSSIPDGVEGPVLITTIGSQAQLWPVYRVYSDTFRAFLYGMYPDSPFPWSRGSSYRALRAMDDRGYSLIPVPSRLYGGRGATAVSGKRIAVKGKLCCASRTALTLQKMSTTSRASSRAQAADRTARSGARLV